MLQQSWATTTQAAAVLGHHHYTGCSSTGPPPLQAVAALGHHYTGCTTTQAAASHRPFKEINVFAGCSDVEDKLPNFEASRMFFSDGTLSAFRYALLLGVTCLATFFDFTRSSPDVSGYLSKVLRNYTEQACDGDFLSVRCPARTTITVQSAFYGRRGPSHPQQCPQTYRSLLGTYPVQKDDRYCSVSTALQSGVLEVRARIAAEAPDRAAALLLARRARRAHNRAAKTISLGVQGGICSPAPSLLRLSVGVEEGGGARAVWPGQLESSNLRDCQSGRALQVVMEHCQGKKSCLLRAATRDFGDPCYSGTRKYLSVIYTC
ncbi:unnamed protein product, partial [Gadus morhua 'NCC']